MRLSLLLLSLGLLTAAGCANRSLSAHQCQAGDWYTVGYNDGQNGVDQGALLRHQDACGRHGIVPDSQRYRAGWNEGVARFCLPQSGYDQGRNGRGFRNVCPADLAEPYRLAWDDGRLIFEAHRDVNRLQEQIIDHERRIEHIGETLISKTGAQIDPTLTPEERVALVAESKALLEERDRLQRELPSLAIDLDDARAHLQRVDPDYAYRN